MGIKKLVKRAGARAADTITKMSVLSPEQLKEIQKRREVYLSDIPGMDDDAAEELTKRLLAAGSIEIFNEYLNHIHDLYVPVRKDTEYEHSFKPGYNIRYFNITKWVTDRKENSIEKLVNVYEVLSEEECNIALIFQRTMSGTNVYMAVVNTKNAESNRDVEEYRKRLLNAIRGNFPGSEYAEESGKGIIPFMDNSIPYSVASASNIPGEKSEKFISQTVEKLLDGMIPETREQEYTLILLATPVNDVEDRKLHLAELYSALFPYAGWQTSFTYQESDSTTSMATFGVNAGVSAGVQHGQNTSVANTSGTTDSTGQAVTDSRGSTETDTTGLSMTESQGYTTTDTISQTDTTGSSYTDSSSSAHTEGNSSTHTDSKGIGGNVGGQIGILGTGANFGLSANSVSSDASGSSVSDMITSGTANTTMTSTANTAAQSFAESAATAVASSTGKSLGKTISQSVANSLGRAVNRSQTITSGVSKGRTIGGNFGANFARASTVCATVGKNEGITQNFSNYMIRHTLELLESQMKRYEQSTALGMWDFAAYVLSEDQNIASNVAHTYLALTQGEESYQSRTAVNVWRGDMGKESDDAKEIGDYLRELRHPLFGLSPALTNTNAEYNAYPAVVTATTSLSGKELAYSLNFPQRSVAGFPVIECTEFGRNVIRFGADDHQGDLQLGTVFHMGHEEKTRIALDMDSLRSHTFITGSTGSGKSNTVYQILEEAMTEDVPFLVIEPAKGEYKHVFGTYRDVKVYGTNPYLSPMLRINPFSFSKEIHIFEHLDRLVEIFNACWPMFAAMPAVLQRAIEESYKDCGWDLVRSTNQYDRTLFPTFADVTGNIKKIIDISEFDSENKGAYKGALVTRLESLTNGINGTVFVTNELDPETLFDEKVIVDLSRIGSTETKSLMMGMLILKLQEYRMAKTGRLNAGLKHITVLEEAHNILRRTSTDQLSESSNLSGKSVEMISNAIAEMRSYGEGFIIVDQAPGLLDLSAIRNTNTKIIMRLPDQGDRELAGRAANLNEDQITELAKLPCGVAAVYQNEWIQPVLCKVDYHDSDDNGYAFSSEEDPFKDEGTNQAAEALFDFLTEKPSVNQERKMDLSGLEEKVLNSRLNSQIRMSFIRYLKSEEEEKMDSFGSLMYEFFSAEDAVRTSKRHNELDLWTESVAEHLNPSVKELSEEQVSWIVGFILLEQIKRDASYRELFERFTAECIDREIFSDEWGNKIKG